jgi:hypothetical protein
MWNILVAKRISLDHDLMFVQVDDIHQIDVVNILHIVFQNQTHRD